MDNCESVELRFGIAAETSSSGSSQYMQLHTNIDCSLPQCAQTLRLSQENARALYAKVTLLYTLVACIAMGGICMNLNIFQLKIFTLQLTTLIMCKQKI